MPEQNNRYASPEGNDQIAESESLIEELKRMVEESAAPSAEAGAISAAPANVQPEAAPVQGVFETYVPGGTTDFSAREEQVQTPTEYTDTMQGYADAQAPAYGQSYAPPAYRTDEAPAYTDPYAQADAPAASASFDSSGSYTSTSYGTDTSLGNDNSYGATTGEARHASDPSTAIPPRSSSSAGKNKVGLIVGIAIAALALLGLLYALTQMGSCSMAGDEAQMKEATTAAMEELAHPSATAKAELAEGISEGFEMTAGFKLDELGITPAEYTEWVLGGISYEVGESTVRRDGDSGTTEVTVNARDMRSFNTLFAKEIETMAAGGFANVTSYEDLYAKIGEAMRAAMGKTGTAESTVTFELTKDEGTWVVNEDSKETCFSSILAGDGSQATVDTSVASAAGIADSDTADDDEAEDSEDTEDSEEAEAA